MKIENTRFQMPVGQGFFHAGWVGFPEAEERFFYVYDCGAMNKFAFERDREIKKLNALVGDGARLDLLVISHMHADHVNGIEALVTDGKLKVDTIMMPMIEMKERLLSFATTAYEDPASAESNFFKDFIVDPVAAVSRFGPRNILLVGRGDGGAPGSGSPDDSPLDGGPYLSGEGRGYTWKLVGQGSADVRSLDADRPQIVAIPDTSAIKVFEFGNWQDAWLIAPYVDEEITAKNDLFLTNLANELHITVAELEGRLSDSSFSLDLITNHADKLQSAFKSCHGNLNRTSLCLYSGPAASVAVEHGCQVQHGPWVSNLGHQRIAWLATGDAKLSKDAKCDALLAHFKDHLDKVSTLTLPHHGAAGDFNQKLLTSTKPSFCPVAADEVNDWQHPAASVTRSVASEGAMLLVVNANETTSVREYVWTGTP
ncbi:Metallo-beta-lactamase superfamily protein [Aliiroseovarius sediminilitoris]|uniref:Metallo-beta-lactamase superfamily protein n=1 Tax=Aliiroseovarius sediminilitoris TaxID=1173584 RepID=A0A1I0NVM7_9RHOB|nr:MBL fold metallo-hydrolase [Aliiroseovarius sediminilitoris]SEW05658.1 Metallo-beta-lactamase superfamily protein [Aliiroseovarius sediminilitoris]